MLLISSIIYFIVCHGGPGDHFSVFAKNLSDKGHTVEVHATGPAVKKFTDSKVPVSVFSLDTSLEKKAKQLALECKKADVVITDVGHVFALSLQKALRSVAPQVHRIAYYDNPERYVPGGYSSLAAKVMQQADTVLFANANLAINPIYQAVDQKLDLPTSSKVGLGYYPVSRGQALAKKREEEQQSKRAIFFTRHNIQDKGQKLFVYTGGNNATYFSNAFPAYLKLIRDLSKEKKLSDLIFVLQQHPGAKEKNLDVQMLNTWRENNANLPLPQFIISDLPTQEALVIADAVFYYQTSMAPQFVLAGIPTVQIGHECYEDILVRNNLCFVVNAPKQLLISLAILRENCEYIPSTEIEASLGICSNWSEVLEQVVTTPKEQNKKTG